MQPGRKTIASIFVVLVFSPSPLEEGGVTGHAEAVVGVEACTKAAHFRKVYGPFHFHQPCVDRSVHPKVEDGGGEGTALSDSAFITYGLSITYC